MHGLMVDVLADGKALLYARARHYDPEHGRWLQRDPLGFIDGPNLYEAFGGNTLVHADPLGLRYKIASSWENGAEVFWQDIDWFTWSMAGKPVNDFSLGRYYCIEGQKLVVYKGPLSSIRDFREATHYVLSLDAVEELGRQKLDWDTYEKLLYVHADAFRVGYDGLIEQLGSPAGIWVHQLAVDLSLQAQAHNRQVMNSLGSIGTRRLGMLLSGGVDPVTESNMTGREIAVEIGLTAVEVALILGPAVVPEMEMAATARSAAGETLGVASGRIAPSNVAKVATGERYSVAFQTELKPTSYPGLSRGAHFQEANGNLLRMMEGDAQFAQSIRGMGIDIERTATGLVPRSSPNGWTWHHNAQSGVMQLVPRAQHTPGSIFWDTLHPGGQGGYSIWGQ